MTDCPCAPGIDGVIVHNHWWHNHFDPEWHTDEPDWKPSSE